MKKIFIFYFILFVSIGSPMTNYVEATSVSTPNFQRRTNTSNFQGESKSTVQQNLSTSKTESKEEHSPSSLSSSVAKSQDNKNSTTLSPSNNIVSKQTLSLTGVTVNEKWGDVPWVFDTNTGTLTFTGGGNLGGTASSPWNRGDGYKISATAIKKIIFTQLVVAPKDSSYLFSSSLGTLSKVTSIEGLDLLDTSNVTAMASMFDGMNSLTSLDVSHFDTSHVTNMYGMFNGLTSLSRLTLGAKSRFNSTVNLPDIPKGDGNTGDWIEKDDPIRNVGSSTQFMTKYDGSHPGTYIWQNTKTGHVWGDVPWTFDENTGTLIFIGGGTLGEFPSAPWNYAVVASDIEKIIFTQPVVAPENSSYLLSGPATGALGKLTNLTSIEGLDLLDTSKATDMTYMFEGMESLTTLDLSHFDTSNVTKMAGMFYLMWSLTSLDLSHFDTSKVTDMGVMFWGMKSLTTLDLSHFDMSKVTTVWGMFYGDSLSSLTLGAKNKFNSSVNLPDIPKRDGNTGNWIKKDDPTLNMGTSTQFMTNYDGSHPGTYVWQVNPGAPVTVKYEDETGKTLHTPQSLAGSIGATYDASSEKYKLDLPGYSLDTKKLPKNATGTFSNTAQTVTYVYQTNPEGAPVTVKYEDETGKTLHTPQSLAGSIGATYDASSEKYKLDLPGYSLDTKKLPKNATGTFSNTAQTVTYVYRVNPVPQKSQPIYRLYNPNTGEHFYTASSYEYDSVAKAGWRKEGIAWKAPKKGAAVYRLYNPNTGEHFYTLSSYEYNSVAKAGWRKEGIAFYSDNSKGVPVYRAFNPNTTGAGSHFYTRSSYEYNNAIKAGWRKEGIAFYGVR